MQLSIKERIESEKMRKLISLVTELNLLCPAWLTQGQCIYRIGLLTT